MLFLTNFLMVTGFMAIFVAYVLGVTSLSDWAADKWGLRGFSTVWGVLIFLPMMILFTLGMTYGT